MLKSYKKWIKIAGIKYLILLIRIPVIVFLKL